MALLPHASLANIYASLDRYLTEQFVDTGLLAVRLHGQRRFTPPVDAGWIEAHYQFLGLQQTFQRSVARYDGAEVHASERRGQLQLNLYQRARVFATRYTTAAMRDLVVNAFPDSGTILIYDFSGTPDTPAAPSALLHLDGLDEAVLDDGYRSGLLQHVLHIQTRYLEQFTR